MALPVTDVPVPIRECPDGSYRIGDTKVLLEAFVWAYAHDGLSPAALREEWPGLTLQQVHAVIAYYLANRSEVDAYVDRSRVQVQAARNEHLAAHGQPGREELAERRRGA